MLTLLPLTTAILGAILGATLAYWLQRARPLVVVDSIRLRVDYSSDQVSTKVNPSLGQQLLQYERDLGVGAIVQKGTATERDYVSALTQAQLGLQDEIDNVLPRIIDATKDFRDHLISEEYSLADQSFARDSYIIWTPIAVASVRGQFNFPTNEPKWDELGPDQNERRRYHNVTTDDAGRIVVDMPGPFSAVLDTFEQPAKLNALANRIANALAYRHRPDLLIVVNSARNIAEDRRTRARALVRRVAQELDPYRRFIVEGIVANAGRTSFSVSNRCKFVVNMKGYRSRTRTLEDDSEILFNLGIRSASSRPTIYVDKQSPTTTSSETERTLDFSTPVLVQPGQSQRFTCVSDSVANDLAFSEELLQAFEGGNQRSYLALGSIRNRRTQFSVIYSRSVLFRDLVHTAELPRRSSWRTRRRLRAG